MSHHEGRSTGDHEFRRSGREEAPVVAPKALWTAGSLTVLLGLAGSFLALGAVRTLALASGMSVLGAAVHLARSRRLPVPRHPVLTITACIAVLGLLSCLIVLPGGAAVLVLVGVLIATASVVGLIHRGEVYRPVHPVATGGTGAADPLEREWMHSTAQLQESRSVADRLVLVGARQHILDDLLERNEGRVPGYVWASVDGPRSQSSQRSD